MDLPPEEIVVEVDDIVEDLAEPAVNEDDGGDESAMATPKIFVAGAPLDELHDDDIVDEVGDTLSDDESDYCETDLEVAVISEDETANDVEEVATYKKACKSLSTIPATTLIGKVFAAASNPTKSMIVLNLSHHGLGDRGGQALAKALTTFDGPLEEVFVADNGFGQRGGSAVLLSLLKNATIKTLDMSKNKLGRRGAEAAGQLLQGNTSIVRLNLSDCAFLDKDAAPISAGISDNATVTALNLSRNEFESGAGASLGPALATNDSIRDLDLSWNKLRLIGGKQLCEALSNHTSITTLSLGYNGVADVGATAFASGLGSNSVLETVDLTNNRIEAAGCAALATALRENKKLHTIVLANNPIGDDGIISWIECLGGNNSSLVSLDLRRVTFNAETSARAIDFLKQSHALLHEVEVLNAASEKKRIAVERWESFETAKESIEQAKATLAAIVEEGKWEELGAAIGALSIAESSLASLLGSRTAVLHRQVSTVNHGLVRLMHPFGDAVFAARRACVLAVVQDPSDTEGPITAAYGAYVDAAIDFEDAPVEDALKYTAGFAALSGVCAADAAKVLYAQVLQNTSGNQIDDIEKARKAANTGFKTLFGPAFHAGLHAYTETRLKHRSDPKKSYDAAQKAYLANGGNAAFGPFDEIKELEAISVANKEYVNNKKDGDTDPEKCIANALNEYRDAFGKGLGSVLPDILELFSVEQEYEDAVAEVEGQWRAAKDSTVGIHEKAVKAEAAARSVEHAAGKRPDFDLKLDLSINSSLTVVPQPSVLEQFLDFLDHKGTTPFEFFCAVDARQEGVIGRLALMNLVRDSFAERLADLVGLPEVDGDESESPPSVDYKTFMAALFAEN